MTLLSLAEPNSALGRVLSYRLGLAVLAVVVLIVGLASPGLAVVGTQDITQLAGTDGCVSKDGTEGGSGPVVCGVEAQLANPQSIAASPDNKHVYVALSGSQVLVFTINKKLSKTGGPAVGALLLPAGATSGGGTGKDILVSGDGKHVYVASGANVFMFSRDKKTGALTQLTPPKIDSLDGAEGLAITKDGKSLYVAQRGLPGVTTLARDNKTGLLTKGTCVESDPGVNSPCTAGVGLKGANEVAVSGDGKNVYVVSDASNAIAIFTRDKKTGNLTQAASPDGCVSQTGQDGSTGPNTACVQGRGLNGATGVAVTADGNFVYVTSTDSNAIAIFSRDKKTGALTQLADIAGCVSQGGNDGNAPAGAGLCTAADIGGLTKVQNVVVSSDGAGLYTTSNGKASGPHQGAVAAFARDETTGALTQVSCTGPDSDCTAGVGLHQARGITITNDGKHVYTSTPVDDAVAAFERDK